MADRFRRRGVRREDRMQDKKVRGVSAQAGREVSDAGRTWLLDTRLFVLHNRHVKSEFNYDARCVLCTGLMAENVGLLEIPVRESGVDQGGGTDQERPTTSPPGIEFWEELLGKGE